MTKHKHLKDLKNSIVLMYQAYYHATVSQMEFNILLLVEENISMNITSLHWVPFQQILKTTITTSFNSFLEINNKTLLFLEKQFKLHKNHKINNQNNNKISLKIHKLYVRFFLYNVVVVVLFHQPFFLSEF